MYEISYNSWRESLEINQSVRYFIQQLGETMPDLAPYFNLSSSNESFRTDARPLDNSSTRSVTFRDLTS
jgi:hypothetical protein